MWNRGAVSLLVVGASLSFAYAGDFSLSSAAVRQFGYSNPAGATKIKVGYTTGNSFTLNDNTTSARLSGPEIGLEVPFKGVGGLANVVFAPSVLLGGQLNKGSDLDGYVYRLNLIARTGMTGANAFYGIGYNYATPRGGANFSKKSGTEIVIGGAAPLIGGGFEIAYHITSLGPARGFTVSFNLGF